MGEEEICWKYLQGIKQREEEIARGDGLEGTRGYELKGCFGECRGRDKTRKCYQTWADLDREIEEMANQRNRRNGKSEK